jgi:hypothetical protein
MYIKSNFIPIELYEKYVGSKFKDKNISLFNDYVPSESELQINPVNILLIQEPNQFFGLHDWAIQNAQKFSCILTWSQSILDCCENALLLPFGTTFLHGKDKYKELSANKKDLEISFLCGPKKMIEGHFLRHSIFEKENDITVNKKWIYSCPGEEKYKCFENSMFHLTIENSKNQNYFTEKIVDAFVTKTIPVYWGCPNIEDFFDTRGFFTFTTKEEAVEIINSLTEEDYYSRLPYIEANYDLGIYYAHYFNRAADILDQIVALNNL